MMINQKRFSALVAAVMLSTISSAVWARGFGGGASGGGGGGFRGGGQPSAIGGGWGGGGEARGSWGGGGEGRGGEPYHWGGDYNGDFNRGDFNRGGEFNRGGAASPYHPYNSAIARPAAEPHVSEAALQAGANKTYNWGRNIASDSGFGKLTTPGQPGAIGHITPAEMTSRAENVRNNYRYRDVFDRNWWANHNDAWGYGYGGWGYGWGWAWDPTDWDDLAGWWGLPVNNAPTDYDYGNNIMYENNMVYYGTQPVESATTYYDQAYSLAASAPISAAESNIQQLPKNWKPLGVFSLVQGGQSSTTTMFQLAVDKEGAIKGNYYNALTGDNKPVTGAIDKKSMRAAWMVANNKTVVYETGLANLLEPQCSILVHFGKDNTEQWTLVRLDKPKTGS
jgi:hypothetical protein